MTTEFIDIIIVSFNDSLTRSAGSHSLETIVVLDLSTSPPPEWANDFNNDSDVSLYGSGRNAFIKEGRLEICCTLDKFENDHLPVLKKVIAATNEAYRKKLDQRQRERESLASKRTSEREKLAELKKNIKLY
jgi:hypothetical protein